MIMSEKRPVEDRVVTFPVEGGKWFKEMYVGQHYSCDTGNHVYRDETAAVKAVVPPISEAAATSYCDSLLSNNEETM